MHISALEEYGLRCALQLASLEADSTISASQIAEHEGISMQYASKIMYLFRKSGLVLATRGIQGGFRLSREASEITIKQVFAAINGEEEEVNFCSQFKGQQKECVHTKECSVRPVWQIISGYFDAVLEQLSLKDLQRGEGDARKRIELFAQKEANGIQKRFPQSIKETP